MRGRRRRPSSMLKHMLTQGGGGPQAAATAVNGGGGTRMAAATATVVGIPSVEVRKLDDVVDITVTVLQKPLAKNCMYTATTPIGADDTVQRF